MSQLCVWVWLQLYVSERSQVSSSVLASAMFGHIAKQWSRSAAVGSEGQSLVARLMNEH